MRQNFWTKAVAWKVQPERLPQFLKELQSAESALTNPPKYAKHVGVKEWGDYYIVTAMTIPYPFQENKLTAIGTPTHESMIAFGIHLE